MVSASHETGVQSVLVEKVRFDIFTRLRTFWLKKLVLCYVRPVCLSVIYTRFLSVPYYNVINHTASTIVVPYDEFFVSRVEFSAYTYLYIIM